MVFSLKDSSDSIGKPSPSLSPIISSTSTSLRNSCILENGNGNQTPPINSSSNSVNSSNSSGRILLSQKQRSINISNEQSQFTQQQIQLQQTGNIESNDPNSPKYLTSSHSTVVIPQSPTPSSSPLLQDLLSNGSGIDNGSGSQSPFITSPKGPNSPRRLVGFFSKSTSYQSLLSKVSNGGSNSTTTYGSNNGSISNSIHTSFNENDEITSTSSSLVNSTTSTTTTSTTTYSINNNNNNNSPEQQQVYSPSNKRLIRHEKSKSSPPLSPIIPNYYNSLLDNLNNNNIKNNNNNNNNNNNGGNNNSSGNSLPFSLNKENLAPNSLIPNISALKLDNVSTSPNGTHIIFSNQPPVVEKDEKEREKDEKDLDNYINMINNSGFISNASSNSNDNSLISNGGTFSPIKEELSPLPSPSFSPKPTLTRTRSNSKNVLYSPNASPSNSCKLSTPSTPPLTPLTPPPLHNISIVESPTTTTNNNNIDTTNKNTTTTANNNNIQQTPNNKLNTSNPINITNSTLKKSGNIDYLQINNNYVIPSPSPGTIGCNYPPVSIVDFTLIEKIGEGGFGQVFLAKKNDTGEIVAIKRMSKDLIWSKNKVSHIKNERDILAQGKNHRWIVSLVYSFQDDHYLYLAMEYVPGGDLRSLLSALSSLDEDSARFYMAEMVEAVDSCHRLGYCHRDLKPENFLISRNGHVKLADFGLSKNVITRYMTQPTGNSDGTNTNTTTPTQSGLSSSLVEHTPMKFGPLNSSVTDFGSFNKASKLAYSVVGSPFYMAPEVLQATRGYGDEVDWWSLGCMFYEFIFGVPPFDGDSPEEVMESVLLWKTMLHRPDGVSDQLWDLISGLINDGQTRLGSGELGVENIKNHIFFKDVQWGRLHELEPPFVPLLQDDYDTTYFENTEKIDSNSPPSLLGIQSISPPSQQQPLSTQSQPPPTPTNNNNNDGGKKILDKIRSPIVYTNKHSGNIITSRSRPRNILGFTYPRAEDQPLLWNNNLLKNFEEHVESSNNNKLIPVINSIPIPIINNNNNSNNSSDSSSGDEGSLTPTNQSPYNNQVIQQEEPSSPYGSYSNNNPF